MITDRIKQERWVEHYTEFYTSENSIISSVLNGIKSLSSMEKLDAEPALGELDKAINSLAPGKDPSNNGIPPHLVKYCRSTLLCPLHEILCLCWRQTSVPHNMHDAKIVTLYENKKDRSNCNNYRGISLQAFFASSLHASYLADFRNWLIMSTKSHSVVSELRDLPWI